MTTIQNIQKIDKTSKEYRNAYAREWRQKNKDKHNAIIQRYRSKNPKMCSQITKRWRKKYPEKYKRSLQLDKQRRIRKRLEAAELQEVE